MSKISRIVLNTVLNCRVAVFGICKNRKKSKTVKSAIVAGALSLLLPLAWDVTIMMRQPGVVH